MANYFIINVDIKYQILTIVGFGIGILTAFLPMNRNNEFFFPTAEEAQTGDLYSKRKFTFLEVKIIFEVEEILI